MIMNLLVSPSGLILDAVLVGLLVLFAFIGYKRGFIRSISKLFGGIIALAVAYFFSQGLFNWINSNWAFEQTMIEKLTETLSKIEPFSVTIGEMEGNIEEGLRNALGESFIPTFMVDKLVAAIQEQFSGSMSLAPDNTIAMLLAVPLGRITCTAICWAGLFIVTLIVLSIVTTILSKTIFRPKTFAGSIDKVVGFAAGALFGVIIIYAACAVVSVLNVPSVATVFQNSVVGNFLFNHNFLSEFITRFMVS